MCACTHTEPAKASGTFATMLLIIIQAELYSLRSLTCFAALKGFIAASTALAGVWIVLTGSQLALVQSSAIWSLARPRICSPWEKGATPASISQGGVGSLRDTGRGGSSQVNFPWVTMRPCGRGICKSVGSRLKSSQVTGDGARRAPVFSELCQTHEIAAPNVTGFMHTEKISPTSLYVISIFSGLWKLFMILL